jgi:hypothetical protein
MRPLKSSILLPLLGSLLLAACGGSPEASPTPTTDPDQIRTQAVGTFAADLTQTALAAPTETPTPTLSPTPFATIALGTPLATTSSNTTGGASTCYRLVYVRDITIPDNTAMTPGQTFTKTWEVQNSGSCAWDAGFKFSLIGGDAMGGQTLTLSQPVAAGGATQLSVAMTAPTNKTGTIQGAWRMSTATGSYFGDQLTVVIVIGGAGGSATATTGGPTGTPTQTPTPTSTTEE